ncbi:MAG: PrsW family intramembrane metalloprotease [Anaerolineae bacterium]
MSPVAVFALSVVAAVIPTMFYVSLIYWVDRYEKEPWWLLAAAFLWGAIPSIIIALLFNTLFSLPVYLLAGEVTGDALTASFIAPPVEESVKGMALLGILLLWRHEIDSPLDGIIYGAMVGMGFAMVENVAYFVTVFGEGGAEAWGINIFMRAIIFGLNHALFTSMTGLGIAAARLTVRSAARFVLPFAGWMTAVLLHFLHNFSLSFNNTLCFVALISDWGGVWLTLAIIFWALLQERRWMRRYLAEEVRSGYLTVSQYETASSASRAWRNFNVLLSQGVSAYWRTARFYYRCSELAYKKHHFSLFQDEKSKHLIEKLRREVVALSPHVL